MRTMRDKRVAYRNSYVRLGPSVHMSEHKDPDDLDGQGWLVEIVYVFPYTFLRAPRTAVSDNLHHKQF